MSNRQQFEALPTIKMPIGIGRH